MYNTAHFHGLGQTFQEKVVEVKKTDVNKFVYFQIQCTLPLTFMTCYRHFNEKKVAVLRSVMLINLYISRYNIHYRSLS